MKSKKGLGLVAFHEVRKAFKAEKALKRVGYMVKAVVPPPEFRKGCDLAVEFDIVERLGVERILRDNKIKYIDIVSVDAAGIEPLELVKTTDFGDSIMIRVGPMKITIEKRTGIIRNISGGGCSDIPYLYIELVNKKIIEAPRPKEIGRTLCAYLLDKAFEEALKIYRETKC